MTDKGKLNYLIDCGLIITFLLTFVTGIIRFPELTRYFVNIYLALPASLLSKIHDFSGLAMSILVLFHLMLHRGWLIAMTRMIIRR